MKEKSKFIFLLLVGFLFSCKEESTEIPLDCGCSSSIVKTIPESSALSGKIYYKAQLDPQDNYYNKKFWISYVENGCINCKHNMIVCNEDQLPQEILDLKNDTSKDIEVKFSGELKETCDKIISPADYTYQNITLNKIQIQ